MRASTLIGSGRPLFSIPDFREFASAGAPTIGIEMAKTETATPEQMHAAVTEASDAWKKADRIRSAAPDLLAIAKRIEDSMDFDASDHPMFKGMQAELVAAIAKAEGRS